MPRWFDSSEPDFEAQLAVFLSRRQQHISGDIAAQVAEIIAQVRQYGDEALYRYTQRWDRFGLNADNIKVTPEEMEQADFLCPSEVKKSLELAVKRIGDYHKRQMPGDYQYQDEEGNTLGWQWRALPSVGLYVPGGKAAYPSSVLMNALPAKVAGVPRLAMVVPAPEGYLNPAILVAARLAGVDEIYKIGGAQAIAALAYGTQRIQPVAKIVGPGNSYVSEAQRQVFGQTGIDMIAGPSEICVVADRHNNPAWIAADLLSQAEHSEDSQSILITDDKVFAQRVAAEVEIILQTLPRKEIAVTSWQEYGAIIIIHNRQYVSPIIDQIAPEHVELAIEEPEALAKKLRCVGAIFLGRHTPEAFGDYTAGPSHVLPTNASARFCSGLSVYNFLNRHSIISATEQGFQRAGKAALILAETEGLHAHALSLQCRLKQNV